MNEISKVSDITASDVADYLRLDEIGASDTNTLTTLLTVAKNYVMQYTGQTQEGMDNYPDLVIVVLILCQDMWDNRSMYVDTSNVNKVVESIMSLHAVNLL